MDVLETTKIGIPISPFSAFNHEYFILSVNKEGITKGKKWTDVMLVKGHFARKKHTPIKNVRQITYKS